MFDIETVRNITANARKKIRDNDYQKFIHSIKPDVEAKIILAAEDGDNKVFIRASQGVYCFTDATNIKDFLESMYCNAGYCCEATIDEDGDVNMIIAW